MEYAPNIDQVGRILKERGSMHDYLSSRFEIIGSFNAGAHGEELGARKTETIVNGKIIMWNGPVINRKPLYKRLIIKRKAV